MSQWSERLLNHSVWGVLSALGPIIDSALQRTGLESSDVDSLERVRAVLAVTGKRLASADPVITYLPPVDGIAQEFNAATTNIQAFIEQGDSEQLKQANVHADSVLHFVAQVSLPTTIEELEALRSAAVAYRSTLEQLLQQAIERSRLIASTAEEAQSKLSQLSVSIDTEQQRTAQSLVDFQTQFQAAQDIRVAAFAEERQRLVQAIGDSQTQFAAAQESRATQFAEERQRLTLVISDHQSQFAASQESRNNQFTEERQRLVQLAAEQQTQFSASQDVRNTQFSDAQSARQDKFSEVMAQFSQKLSDQDADFSRQKELALRKQQADLDMLTQQYVDASKNQLDRIDDHRRQVEKLVGVIGNLGVTSGYLKVANHSRWSMWIWQGVTVAAMVALIAAAYKMFIPLMQGTFNWESFAGRVFLSVTIGVLAAYSGSQADKFFEMERRNRKLSLELEAIGPYLAPLPQEMQDKFRIDIGERSFGREEPGDNKAPEKSPATVLDVLSKSKDLQEFVVNLVKAAGASK